MEPGKYLDIKAELIERGYAKEIDWTDEVGPCEKPINFFLEFAWVVVNSGMRNQVAEKIYKKIINAIKEEIDISTVFGHKGKVAAIKDVWKNQYEIFTNFQLVEDKISFLEELPWIGKITKFHLARNLGYDFVKPDRHLVRVANSYNMTPNEMCEKLVEITGDRLGTVDVVIWRAANLKMI